MGYWIGMTVIKASGGSGGKRCLKTFPFFLKYCYLKVSVRQNLQYHIMWHLSELPCCLLVWSIACKSCMWVYLLRTGVLCLCELWCLGKACECACQLPGVRRGRVRLFSMLSIFLSPRVAPQERARKKEENTTGSWREVCNSAFVNGTQGTPIPSFLQTFDLFQSNYYLFIIIYLLSVIIVSSWNPDWPKNWSNVKPPLVSSTFLGHE